jgi:hypothetical protein
MACEFEFVLEGPRLLPGEGAGMGINRYRRACAAVASGRGAHLRHAARHRVRRTVTTTADGGPGSCARW